MSDEYDFDYGRAHDLLSIIQLVAEVAPKYTAISSEAMAELGEINEEILEAVKARKQAADEEAAAIKAETDAEVRAQAEADAGEEPNRAKLTAAETSEANKRSALAKQSLDTTAGAPIRRPI